MWSYYDRYSKFLLGAWKEWMKKYFDIKEKQFIEKLKTSETCFGSSIINPLKESLRLIESLSPIITCGFRPKESRELADPSVQITVPADDRKFKGVLCRGKTPFAKITTGCLNIFFIYF